ncbi:hypothetical protein [Nocardioides koreensis]|uniref:hypothetical protein n=1 Tax=Nocardioides koreensis TaxID=433651 RepID=UPI0031E3681D
MLVDALMGPSAGVGELGRIMDADFETLDDALAVLHHDDARLDAHVVPSQDLPHRVGQVKHVGNDDTPGRVAGQFGHQRVERRGREAPLHVDRSEAELLAVGEVEELRLDPLDVGRAAQDVGPDVAQQDRSRPAAQRPTSSSRHPALGGGSCQPISGSLPSRSREQGSVWAIRLRKAMAPRRSRGMDSPHSI